MSLSIYLQGEPYYPCCFPQHDREARGAGNQEGELHLHVPVQGQIGDR